LGQFIQNALSGSGFTDLYYLSDEDFLEMLKEYNQNLKEV
jgi:hypothetical protein